MTAAAAEAKLWPVAVIPASRTAAAAATRAGAPAIRVTLALLEDSNSAEGMASIVP